MRVLRTCRFAARYHHLGFTVAEKTMQLMRDIVRSGELLALAPDRVWRETERALNERTPRTYFSLLRTLGADKIVLPFAVTDNSLDALDSMASIAPTVFTGGLGSRHLRRKYTNRHAGHQHSKTLRPIGRASSTLSRQPPQTLKIRWHFLSISMRSGRAPN